MKKHGFKFIWIGIVLTALLLAGGCGNSTPTSSPDLLVAEFQYGVLPYAGYIGCMDTNMASVAPYADENYGACDQGSAGYFGASAGITRYMIWFDVTSIPSGVTIKKAFLTLSVITSNGSNTMSCHVKTSSWATGSDCGALGVPSWNSTSGGEPFNPASAGSVAFSSTKNYSISISPSAVQAWIDDSTQNNGLLLKTDNEADYSYLYFYFADSVTVSYRPKLTVYYTVN
jgi:hypothetical protein